MAKLKIEPVDANLKLRVWAAPRARRVLVFFPGGACRAERYDWLAGLNAGGTSVMIVDAAAPGANLAQLGQAFEVARRHSKAVFAGGHSAGAALVQDALDPAAGRANPRMKFPDDYEPPRDLAGLVVMGCSLQSRPLNMELTYRSDTRLLYRPGDMPILFIAGDHDRLATPELTALTQARYAPPTQLMVIKGGTHYGYAAGHDSTDNPAVDNPDGADLEGQRKRCLDYMAVWLAGGRPEPVPGDSTKLEVLGRRPQT